MTTDTETLFGFVGVYNVGSRKIVEVYRNGQEASQALFLFHGWMWSAKDRTGEEEQSTPHRDWARGYGI